MKVYSLTGKSGTGKSYQAMALCEQRGIESIIDDGLFIFHHRVEAGISAKREKSRVGAIKTALFTTDEHADAVRNAIAKAHPKNLLIIGTSDRMTDKIVARLGLPPVEERIYIEEISTENERKIAEKQRLTQGKHVIPVPTLQLKRDFAGYFLDPLRIFHGGIFGSDKDKNEAERTVVRPTFSYMGDFFISDTVITDIAHCLAEESEGIAKIIKVYENTAPDSLDVDVSVALESGYPVWDVAERFQKELLEEIESMTAFNVVRVDVDVKQIVS
ncbi:MAG: Asp23/Gls24 family envelope stress response protein [Bacillota bacterium]|nr:Asp23/Gls24 family envelope stress response protein [Bacillota bacterium]